MPPSHNTSVNPAVNHAHRADDAALPAEFEAWLNEQSLETVAKLHEKLLELKTMPPEQRTAYLKRLATDSVAAQKRVEIFEKLAILGEKLLPLKKKFDEAIERLDRASLHVDPDKDMMTQVQSWMEQWGVWQTAIRDFTSAEREAVPALREVVAAGIVAKIEDELAQIQETRTVELRAPDFYYALAARREQEDKEMRKLQTANKDELISFFMTALHEKDESRAGAILRKLANDYNDNEIWNHFGYPASTFGMHLFFMEVMCGLSVRKDPTKPIPYKAWFDQVEISKYFNFDENGRLDIKHAHHITTIPGTSLHTFHMPFQMALSLESDVSYINEERSHWETARVIGVDAKTGEYYQYAEFEHAIECVAELRKIQPRDVQRKLNRLGYGGEVPKEILNLSGGREFQISLLGIMINLAIGDPIHENTIQREMNTGVKYLLSQPHIRRQIDRVAPPKVRKFMAIIAKYAPAAEVGEFSSVARKAAAAKGGEHDELKKAV